MATLTCCLLGKILLPTQGQVVFKILGDSELLKYQWRKFVWCDFEKHQVAACSVPMHSSYGTSPESHNSLSVKSFFKVPRNIIVTKTSVEMS